MPIRGLLSGKIVLSNCWKNYLSGSCVGRKTRKTLSTVSIPLSGFPIGESWFHLFSEIFRHLGRNLMRKCRLCASRASLLIRKLYYGIIYFQRLSKKHLSIWFLCWTEVADYIRYSSEVVYQEAHPEKGDVQRFPAIPPSNWRPRIRRNFQI